MVSTAPGDNDRRGWVLKYSRVHAHGLASASMSLNFADWCIGDLTNDVKDFN